MAAKVTAMFLRLFLLMTVVPVVELWILLWIKDQTSWAATVLLVLLTGMLGATLARWQGWKTVERIQRELANGQMPAAAMVDGLLILVAGVVLITPGLLTDAFGFALLVPAFRRAVRAYLRRRFSHRFVIPTKTGETVWDHSGPDRRQRHDEIIDARVIDVDADADHGQGSA